MIDEYMIYAILRRRYNKQLMKRILINFKLTDNAKFHIARNCPDELIDLLIEYHTLSESVCREIFFRGTHEQLKKLEKIGYKEILNYKLWYGFIIR